MTSIDGKTILLTGASRGLGAELAIALAQKGANIIGLARSLEALESVGTQVQAAGRQWFAIAANLMQTETLAHQVESLQAQVDAIDILINNAGQEKYSYFSDYTYLDLQQILTTNLLAAMELTRLLLPSMQKRGCGHIVNIASLAGKKGPAFNSVYAASKGGMVLWSDALRQELQGTGISLSLLCPGYVSQLGMTADSQVPIPKLAGASTPTSVVNAIIRAIERNQPEALVNQNWFSETVTKLLLATSQVAPILGDRAFRWLGITQANRLRARPPSPPILGGVKSSWRGEGVS